MGLLVQRGRLRGWSFRLADCLLSLFPRCKLQQSFRGHGTFSAFSTEVKEWKEGGKGRVGVLSGQELGFRLCTRPNELRRNGISSRSRCGNLFVNRIAIVKDIYLATDIPCSLHHTNAKFELDPKEPVYCCNECALIHSPSRIT